MERLELIFELEKVLAQALEAHKTCPATQWSALAGLCGNTQGTLTRVFESKHWRPPPKGSAPGHVDDATLQNLLLSFRPYLEK